MAQIITPDGLGQNPQMHANIQMGMDIQRLAVGMDMLVGLLSEKWGYELKESKDANGNTLLRWRPKGTEATEGEGEKPTDSEA